MSGLRQSAHGSAHLHRSPSCIGHPAVRRSAPRRKSRYALATSRRHTPELCRFSRPRGRRECRMPAAPAALRAEKKARKQVTTGTPQHDGIPCAMVLRFPSCSPRRPGFSCLRRRRNAQHCRQLDISVGISGRHDFAVRFRAVRPSAAKTSTASRPTFVTMANAPLLSETREAIGVICPTG